MKYVLADARMSQSCINSLKRENITPIKLPHFSRLSPPVASHPDMLLFLRGRKLYTSKQYYNEAKDVFSLIESVSGVEIITDDVNILPIYPNDIAFNCFDCNGYLFGLTKNLAKTILRDTEKTVNVRQGYASCSTICADEKAIITADRSIAECAEKIGVRVCFIQQGGVVLPRYEYGFIGGACGVLDDTLYFTGDIDTHPCAKQIRDFIKSLGKNIVSLSDSLLCDYGKMLFLP